MLNRYDYRFEEKDDGGYYNTNPSITYNIYSAPFYYTGLGVYVSWVGCFWWAGSDAQTWSNTPLTEKHGGLIHAGSGKIYPVSGWERYHGFSLRLLHSFAGENLSKV